MTLSNLTLLIWGANAALDARKTAPFSFEDLYQAAEERRLLPLLSSSDPQGEFGTVAYIAKESGDTEIEDALYSATSAIEGREIRKTGVGCNPWCLVIAIALEAIQQNFSR